MRDRYRDNDDERNVLERDDRTGGSADRNERGAEGNDNNRQRDDRPDEFDETLERQR